MKIRIWKNQWRNTGSEVSQIAQDSQNWRFEKNNWRANSPFHIQLQSKIRQGMTEIFWHSSSSTGFFICFSEHLEWWFSKHVTRPAATAPLGHLLETQILRPLSYWIWTPERRAEMCFIKPSKWFWCMLNVKNHWLRAILSNIFTSWDTSKMIILNTARGANGWGYLRLYEEDKCCHFLSMPATKHSRAHVSAHPMGRE